VAQPDPRSLFAVAAEGYDRLMGRYLPTLGPVFADAAGVTAGQRVLDVGCGPGGLTAVLVHRVGADHVAAIDPSPPFVAACRERHPGVAVRQGVAEHLPYGDDTYDASLASLVVGFMSDPVAGVGQMRRVTRPGGRVALSFWSVEEMPLLSTFWRGVAAALGPDAGGEADRTGRREGDLGRLLREVGATDIDESRLACTGSYADFEDWWSSFTGGAGPVGAFQQSLGPEQRERVRAACDALLDHPRSWFSLEAFAWCAVGTA
jgi:ubiquinone/menaquinone biosynthesis C-methylase UbiE